MLGLGAAPLVVLGLLGGGVKEEVSALLPGHHHHRHHPQHQDRVHQHQRGRGVDADSPSDGEKAQQLESSSEAETCNDVTGWHNGFGVGCAGYAVKGYCTGTGVAPEHLWLSGNNFNHPETNCCACGKGTADNVNRRNASVAKDASEDSAIAEKSRRERHAERRELARERRAAKRKAKDSSADAEVDGDGEAESGKDADDVRAVTDGDKASAEGASPSGEASGGKEAATQVGEGRADKKGRAVQNKPPPTGAGAIARGENSTDPGRGSEKRAGSADLKTRAKNSVGEGKETGDDGEASAAERKLEATVAEAEASVAHAKATIARKERQVKKHEKRAGEGEDEADLKGEEDGGLSEVGDEKARDTADEKTDKGRRPRGGRHGGRHEAGGKAHHVPSSPEVTADDTGHLDTPDAGKPRV